MLKNIEKKIKKLPDSPGVYFFLGQYKKNKKEGKEREILYIGKAVSLKSRIRSYFAKDIAITRSFLIESLVEKIKDIKVRETDSALEALLLEAELIKKHQPKYNTREKDDKSFNYIAITDEDYPKIILIRGKDLEQKAREEKVDIKKKRINDYKDIYGPYPHGGQLKEALRIIRRIFPFLDEKSKNSYNERFYRQIGLSPDTSSNEARYEYKKTIDHIKLFLEGKKRRLISTLEKEMNEEAQKHNFEKASEIRNKIFSLRHIQDVALIQNNKEESKESKTDFRIEAYDISHISGKFVVGVMTVLENDEIKKSDYRKFKIKIDPGINDTKALKEVLNRRLKHSEWKIPNLIVVDGGLAQKRVVELALKENKIQTLVCAVTKDLKHRPKNIIGDSKFISKLRNQILQANAESHRFAVAYHRQLRDRIHNTDKN